MGMFIDIVPMTFAAKDFARHCFIAQICTNSSARTLILARIVHTLPIRTRACLREELARARAFTQV